jgi:hypothetical protein
MEDITSVNRRRVLGLTAGSLAGAALLSACNLSPTAAGAARSPSVDLYLTLVTGGMIHKKDWPAYLPTDLTVPAHSTVNVRIVNFDDGPAALPANSPYAKVAGVVGGSATAQALTVSSPNTPGQTTTYQELNPKDIAHTFTIGALKLNVPLPVSSIVSFSFETGAPGTYTWQCMAPCGDEPGGYGGAMARPGYMMGSLHVV